MTAKELKEVLKGVPKGIQVAMPDDNCVVFAEIVDGAFVVSDIGPGYDEPIEYWRVEEEAQRLRYEEIRNVIRTCSALSAECIQDIIDRVNECEQEELNEDR